MMDTRQDQIDRNYATFQKNLPRYLETQRGKFALMRDEEVVDFFDTARDAFVAGNRLFGEEGEFSVQQVTAAPVDLGFFSHAVR